MKAGFHAPAKLFAPSTQKVLIGNDFCYAHKKVRTEPIQM